MCFDVLPLVPPGPNDRRGSEDKDEEEENGPGMTAKPRKKFSCFNIHMVVYPRQALMPFLHSRERFCRTGGSQSSARGAFRWHTGKYAFLQSWSIKSFCLPFLSSFCSEPLCNAF